MLETILSTTWARGDTPRSFVMWTLHQAIHILSVMGSLASLSHRAMNTGACPSFSHLHVTKYLQMTEINKWNLNYNSEGIIL
jgi:hypothetical protein